MVPAVNPVRALVKLPDPVPSDVLVLAIVGPVVIFQQTPRAVIAAPPSFVIFPPLVEEVCVIAVTTVVVNDGREGADEVKVSSFP